MNILVLGDAFASGEWIATKRLIEGSHSISPFYVYHAVVVGTQKTSRDAAFFTSHTWVSWRFRGKLTDFFELLFLYFVVLQKYLFTMMIQGISFDRVVTTHFIWLLAARLGPFLWGKPFVYFFQGIRSINPTHIKNSTTKEKILFSIEKLALHVSTIVVCPSASGSTLFRSLGIDLSPQRIFTLPQAIPDLFFSRTRSAARDILKDVGISKQDIVVLFCGRLAAHKGLEVLFVAFGKLAKRNEKARLVVAFPESLIDRSLYQSLVTYAQKERFFDRVSFAWNASDDLLHTLYGRARVTVLPSEFEVAPLVLYESLAAGTPVLIAQEADRDNIMKSIHSQFVLKDNSTKTLIDTLELILSSQKSVSISRQCVAYAEKHRLHDTAKKFNALLDRL